MLLEKVRGESCLQSITQAVFGLRYGLNGPGIESRWGRDFPHMSRQALRSTQPPAQWVPGLSWG